MAQIISTYQVAESLIYRWKQQLIECGSIVFEQGKIMPQPASVDINKLQAKVGQLVLERDFLETALSKSHQKSA